MTLTGHWVIADAGGSGTTVPNRVGGGDVATLFGGTTFTTLGSDNVAHVIAGGGLSVPDQNTWDSNTFTWIMRVAWHSLSGNPCVLGHGEGAGIFPKWAWTRGINGATQEVHYQTAGVTVSGASFTPTVDQIYGVSVKRSGNDWTFGRDGATDGTASQSANFSNAAAFLQLGFGNENFFNTDCYVSTCRMYDSAETDADIWAAMVQDAIDAQGGVTLATTIARGLIAAGTIGQGVIAR